MSRLNLPAFVSERFVITVEVGDDRRKLFQLLFGKKDGSLFVSFPYYKETVGLLTLATLRARQSYPTSISLTNSGKVTGHRVKYTHHPDGRAHFSQSGRIRTEVLRNAVPLIAADGHLFTLQIQGLRDFSELRDREKQPVMTLQKTILNFRFEGSPPEAIKFVGHWHSASSLAQKVSQVGQKPWFVTEKSDGSRGFGMLIQDTFLQSQDPYYLLLTCEAIPILDKGRYSTLTFVGGFDRREIAFDHNQDTSFLALAYPSTDSYEDLLRRIGSVDLAQRPRQSG